MTTTIPNLKQEQLNTLNTPRYNYSFMAKVFFAAMNLVAGKTDDLPKAKLLEILASIPYRVWEIRHYLKLTRHYKKNNNVNKYNNIINWGRHAQDNEYMHLLVIDQKMNEDGIKDKWYLHPFVVIIVVLFYIFLSRTLAFVSQKRAFLFNAEFENHAEHIYATLVEKNPQWENQPLTNKFVKQYANVNNWADVFRRISLDERDHMNHSFEFCGMNQFVVKYPGMPNPFEKL